MTGLRFKHLLLLVAIRPQDFGEIQRVLLRQRFLPMFRRQEHVGRCHPGLGTAFHIDGTLPDRRRLDMYARNRGEAGCLELVHFASGPGSA